MKQRKQKVSLLFALAGITFLLFWAGNATAMQHEICGECHEEVMAAFTKTFHGRAWTAMESTAGCTSCHGTADKHQDDPSKATIITFGKESLQTAKEQAARCLGCHNTSSNLSLWEMGKHSENDVACTSCHSIHTERNVVRQPDTCVGCHKSIRMQINKQSHHPIVEGKVKCSDCHDPHGTLSHHMIRAENVNQLCYKCHADKRGPFIWEHPPVEENCAICHAPHGSRHNKLMTEKIPNLCQDCHDWSRHPGTPYDATDGFAGASPSNRFLARSCLNCHSLIHGSVMPVNPGGTNTYGQGKAFTR